MRHQHFLVFLPALFLIAFSSAQNTTACPTAKGYAQIHRIGGYLVQLTAGPKDAESDRCRGSVTPPGGKRIIFARDWSIWVDDISGSDIDGDGTPDVVFDAFSGGGRCCYTATIVSLSKPPHLVREIHNQLPLRFRKASDGSIEIRTSEGSFDLFLLPHSYAAIPELTLQLQGNKLTDISSKYQAEYDEKIAKARDELTPAALDKFRKSSVHQSMFVDQAQTVKLVLTVVLNYLYSGREQQAWQSLDDMWPPSDKNRVRSLILERQSRGLLAHLSDP
jgi:hypothetical protein